MAWKEKTWGLMRLERGWVSILTIGWALRLVEVQNLKPESNGGGSDLASPSLAVGP